jgi:hypothetical protein
MSFSMPQPPTISRYGRLAKYKLPSKVSTKAGLQQFERPCSELLKFAKSPVKR